MENYNLNKASPDKFQIVFPIFPVMEEVQKSREITLNIFGNIIPGVSHQDNEEHWMGALHHRPVGNLEYNQYTVSFMVDENWENWYFLYKWMEFINNNKDKFATAKPDLVSDSNVLIKDDFNNLVLIFTLYHMFPLSLEDVSLEYRNGESFLESSCSFVYDYYEVEKI